MTSHLLNSSISVLDFSLSTVLRVCVTLYMHLGDIWALGAVHTSFYRMLHLQNNTISLFSILASIHFIILSSQQPCELSQNHVF